MSAYTQSYRVLEVPRPAYLEIRERLIDRQQDLVRREYSTLLREDGAGELLVLGPVALRPIDAVDGVYPRDSWQTQGPGPLDAPLGTPTSTEPAHTDGDGIARDPFAEDDDDESTCIQYGDVLTSAEKAEVPDSDDRCVGMCAGCAPRPWLTSGGEQR